MFISGVLTTFMLAIMFGVAMAYQKTVQTGGVPTEIVQQTQPIDVMAVEPVTATSAVTATLTLEEAANLASSVIGRTDLYSSENTQLDGVDAYLVTFSSGDLVYVSLDGKILSISKLPVKYVLSSQPVVQSGGSSNNNHSSSSSSNEDNHDDHDDHDDDEHDGDDD